MVLIIAHKVNFISAIIKSGGSETEFARSAGLVIVGTVIAQVLPLLFYPIFTRLFSPADFGTFAMIAMIAAPLAILASGMYEQAFLITHTQRSTLNLFLYMMLRCSLVLIVAFFFLLVLRFEIANELGDPALVGALLVVPIISLGQVIYNCTSEWFVRGKAFKALAINRVIQGALLSLAKLGFGFAAMFSGGLVLGEALGRLLYMGHVTTGTWRVPLSDMRQTSWKKIAATGKRYRRFPRVMVPDQLINTFTGSVHVLFIGYAFGPTQLGYVSLIFSALYLPVTVVSSSIKDVFRQRASIDFSETKNCRPIFAKLLAPITLAGIAGFGLLYLIAPWIFVVIFGPDWATAGLYAQLLIPMFFFNFVSMSLGGVLVIANQMKASLWWQITSLIMAVVSLMIGIYGFGNVTDTLIAFTIARSLGYIHYMALSYKYAKAQFG